MSSDQNTPNPYSAPLQSPASYLSTADIQHQKLIKDFRSQSLALGVLWIIFAVLGGGYAVLLLTTPVENEDLPANFNQILGGIAAVLALGWAISGVGTLMKTRWGVYTGLVMSYFALVSSLVSLNVCGLVFIIVILVQAHRVAGFMRQMRQLGIPFNTKS